MQRILRFLLTLFVTSIVSVVVVIYAFASTKAYDVLTLPPPALPKTTPSIPYETVNFVSRRQDYQVYGFFLPSEDSHLALINVPGYKGSRFSQDQLDRVLYLHDLGYNVLSIDLSDQAGETVGNGRIGMGYAERWDVLGAYDYLLARGFNSDQIGLVGESMGAATILLAAAAEPRIKAVWADSAYSRADIVVRERAEANGIPALIVPGGMLAGWLISGDRLWEAAPIDATTTLAAHHQAVYLIHSVHDGTLPFHHALDIRDAYQAANVPVTFWATDKGDHAQAILYYQSEYLRRLNRFFRENLSEDDAKQKGQWWRIQPSDLCYFSVA